MTTPLVSILIPCYNAEKWLAETLESALAQTWYNKEIIFVDDASRDNSLAVAKRYESKIFKVISQKHGGASAARNGALREAQGDFIQYLDADDVLAPGKIEAQIKRLQTEAPGAIAAAAWGRFHYSQPYHSARFIPDSSWNDCHPFDWLVQIRTTGRMMPPIGWLSPRKVLDTAGQWDETLSLNDDGEYFARVLLKSTKIVFCQQSLAYYRSGYPSSLSNQFTPEAMNSRFRTVELISQYLLEYKDSPEARLACANTFQKYIYDVYPNVPHLLDVAKQRVKEFGGSSLKPETAGKIHKFLVHTIGWKAAQRIRIKYSKLSNSLH